MASPPSPLIIEAAGSVRFVRVTTMGRRWFRGRLRQLHQRLFRKRGQDGGEAIAGDKERDGDSAILQETRASRENLIVASGNRVRMSRYQSVECGDPLGSLREGEALLSGLFMGGESAEEDRHHPAAEISLPEEEEEEIPLRACLHPTHHHHQSMDSLEDKEWAERRRRSLDQERLAHLLF